MVDKVTNNSFIHSVNSLELVREHVAKSSLNINADEVTSVYANEMNEIDFDRFIDWFETNKNNIANATNRQRYFNKAFADQMSKGTFKLKSKPDISMLVNAMRSKGIKVSNDDTLYLDVMWTEIFKAGIKEDVAVNLNHSVVEYMKEGDDFQMYVYYIKHSNGLRGVKVNWEKIDDVYTKELAKCKAILNELSLEVIPND